MAKKNSDGEYKWGYINTKGKIVVPMEYDEAGDFQDELAMVAKNDVDGNKKYGIIDIEKNMIASCNFNSSSVGEAFLYVSDVKAINPRIVPDDETVYIGDLRHAKIDSEGEYLAIANPKGDIIVEVNKSLAECQNYYAKAVANWENGKEKEALPIQCFL